MFQTIDALVDLIPLLAAAFIPWVTALAAKTKQQRGGLAVLLVTAVTILEAIAGEDVAFTVEALVPYGAEMFIVQLGAYLGGWKLTGLNERRPVEG